MASLVNFGRLGRGLLLVALVGVIAGCGSDDGVSAPSSDPSVTVVVDAGLGVDEFGIVDSSMFTDSFYPEITEDDIEVIEGDAGTSYRYVFPTREFSDSVSFDLEARWDRVGGGYESSLTWGLTGDETSPSDFVFVASIPKSFAETVDDIVFDPEPTRVIDPDPILEWEVDLSGLVQRRITASSEAGFDAGESSALGMLAIFDILVKANAIRVNAELDACGGRLTQSAEMLGQCYLNVVVANPGAFGDHDCDVMELLSGGRGDDYPGLSAACRTIVDLNKGSSGSVCVKEADGEELEACREAMWSLLSGGCPTGNTLEYQVCVYEAAVAADREYGCESLDLLGNPEMGNDCRAVVTRNYLYCARTEDPELRASCCENFRGTDDYALASTRSGRTPQEMTRPRPPTKRRLPQISKNRQRRSQSRKTPYQRSQRVSTQAPSINGSSSTSWQWTLGNQTSTRSPSRSTTMDSSAVTLLSIKKVSSWAVQEPRAIGPEPSTLVRSSVPHCHIP